jgi:hypothetical protein
MVTPFALAFSALEHQEQGKQPINKGAVNGSSALQRLMAGARSNSL